MKVIKLILALLGSLVTRIPYKWWFFACVISAGFYFLYDHLFAVYFPDHRAWYTALLLSLSMLLPASVFYVLPHWFKELHLLRHADRPRLEDDKRVAVHGTLESGAEQFVTPFTRRPCLYYEYIIYHFEHVKHRSETEATTDFRGFAKAPLVLRSSMGDFHLADYVTPTETFSTKVANPALAPALEAFLTQTLFEESWDPFASANTRVDFKSSGASLGLANQRLEEKHLPPGAEVCIIGTWSSSLMALRSIGNALGTYSVLKGTPGRAALQIVWRITKTVLSALFLALFINLFAFFMITGS
jgi:hypothetical protein